MFFEKTFCDTLFSYIRRAPRVVRQSLVRFLLRLLCQKRCQKSACIRFLRCRDLLRRAFGDHRTAAGTAFRSEVNAIVGCLDHIQIVFDDDHTVAAVHQPLQHLQQTVIMYSA